MSEKIENKKIKVIDDLGKRVDLYLSERLTDISRSSIKKLIKEEKVKVNGKSIKPKYTVKNEDLIEIEIDTSDEEEKLVLEAEKIPLDKIYEDDDLAVVLKPQGMVIYPATDNTSGTLVNALLYNFENLSTLGGEVRPGIVHRIDKDTAGLLMIAKNDNTHQSLSEQLKEHSVVRKYYALVDGIIEEEHGTIDAPVGRHPVNRTTMAVTDENSRPAVTHFKVLERFEKHTLIEAQLETGRTHQIRVHMSYINRPVVGDIIYGNKNQKFKLDGQLLFAKIVGFTHPSSHEYLEFEAPLPDYFTRILDILRINN